MTTAKQLKIETLENALLNAEGQTAEQISVQPQKKPSQKPARKTAKITLPKVGQEFQYTEDHKIKKCFMEEIFDTQCELEENKHIEKIVGYKVEVQRKNRKTGELETKKTQVNKYTIEGLPQQAFFEECQYIEEYYDSEKQKIVSGKRYKFTPNAKEKQILAEVTSKDGKHTKTLVYQF